MSFSPNNAPAQKEVLKKEGKGSAFSGKASGLKVAQDGAHVSASAKNYELGHGPSGLGVNASGPYMALGAKLGQNGMGADAQVGLGQFNVTHNSANSSSSVGLSAGLGGGAMYHPPDNQGHSGFSVSAGPVNLSHKSKMFTEQAAKLDASKLQKPNDPDDIFGVYS